MVNFRIITPKIDPNFIWIELPGPILPGRGGVSDMHYFHPGLVTRSDGKSMDKFVRSLFIVNDVDTWVRNEKRVLKRLFKIHFINAFMSGPFETNQFSGQSEFLIGLEKRPIIDTWDDIVDNSLFFIAEQYLSVRGEDSELRSYSFSHVPKTVI